MSQNRIIYYYQTFTGLKPILEQDPVKVTHIHLASFHFGLDENKKEYITNANPLTYPDGLDAEVMTFRALKKCYKLVKKNYDKEHVTTFIRNSKKFNVIYNQYKKNYSNERWVVDEKSDLIVVKKIFKYFKPRINFGWLEIIKLRKRKPKIFEINKSVKIKNEYKKALFVNL